MRAVRRLTRVTVAAAMAASLAVMPGAEAGDTAKPRVLPQGPIFPFNFGDPTMTKYAGGYLAVSTGDRAPMAHAANLAGPWDIDGPALATLPAWATGASIWAADIEQVGDQWLLYYSALAAGIRVGGRCIGVAVASGPLQPYYPLGGKPLVCSRRSSTPGEDKKFDQSVIDPTAFVEGKKRWLVYKTDDRPSSIRLVRLTKSGLHKKKRVKSVELIRSAGVIENPIMVARDGGYTLITSEGPYYTCGYITTWWRSSKLKHWGKARRNLLFDKNTNGVCGPGGADLLDASTLIFHGWVCGQPLSPCPNSFDAGKSTFPERERAMYAASINWGPNGTPIVTGYVNPPPTPPQDPQNPLPPDPEVP